MVTFIICLLFIGIFSGIFDFKNGLSFDSTTMMAMISFALAVYCIIKLIFSKKRYKKLFDSNKAIEEKCDYCIDENNITISSESGTSILNEEKIYKIIIEKDLIYIFLAANMAKVIKKKFFKNNGEYDTLVLFIKENYKGKIKKK
jgi:hypothetical protein